MVPPPRPFPKSISESDEVQLQVDVQPASSGADRCGAACSLARGGRLALLVPLTGVLLTVHVIPEPKVTSHL